MARITIKHSIFGEKAVTIDEIHKIIMNKMILIRLPKLEKNIKILFFLKKYVF